MSDQIDPKEAYAAEMREVSGQTTPVETTTVVDKAAPAETTPVAVAKADDSATFDINTLPPAAKALLEAEKRRAADLEARYREADKDRRSLKGRLPHLQSKAAQWEKWEAEQKANAAKPPLGKSEPPASLLEALPEWGIHRTQYPADAAPVEAAIKKIETHYQTAIQDLTDKLSKQSEDFNSLRELIDKDVRPRIESVDEIRRERVFQAHEKAQSTFTEKYPDWHTHALVDIDPETKDVKLQVSDKMGDWLDAMPAYMRKPTVELLKSRDPEDAQDIQAVFQRFYDSLNPVDTQRQTQAADTLKSRQEQLTKRAVTTSNGEGLNAEGKLSAAERYRREMQSNFG